MRYVVTENGCWEWLGYVNVHGYGIVGIHGENRRAHRVSYELLVGRIPVDTEIHHVCKNKRCVNPAHLEALTIVEHRRTDLGKDRCVWGHPFDERNTYVTKKGERQCRRCKARRERERQARLRSAS